MPRIISGCLSLSLLLAAGAATSRTFGQPAPVPGAPRAPRPGAAPQNFPPFANPEKFFENFFGQETPADKRKLEQVKISLAEETQIGQRMIDSYLADLQRQQLEVTRQGPDVEHLRQLIALLQPQMKNARRYRQIQVYLVEGKATDARSFPGGHLVFFRGLLDFVESEAALVGVIGHELSHLDHGHQLGPVRRMKLAQQTFTGRPQEFSPARMMEAGNLMMNTFARPFHPEEETEADYDGATWAYRAGYDPREMANLFRRLQQRDGDQPQLPFNFLRTHPYHAERYEAVMQRYEELRRREPRKDALKK